MKKNDCYHLLPHVLRARGFRLYLADGRRLVDLWLNGGAAVMGHTPANFLREIKNTASRGLYSPLPHFTESRLLKALSKLLPGYSFRIYAAPPPELVLLFDRGSVKFWRPFDENENYQTDGGNHILIPILPGIQTWRGRLPMGFCVTAGKPEAVLDQLPENDALSPILLAAATRGVYDLLAAPERVKPVLPRVTKTLLKSRWQRRGIYLNLSEEPNPETWEALFRQFLDAGFLLPPNPHFPLILPGELSDGEEKKLAALLGE
jgi:hypothetical protein